MKLVRRARKSLKERRMKKLSNDLDANLSKVELRVYREKKDEREAKRKRLGVAAPVSQDILQGRMNPDLYEVECMLHERAGLPRPLPYNGYQEDMERRRRRVHRIGFLDFQTLRQAVQRKNQLQRA